MKLEFFIAKRILNKRSKVSSISSPIINISVWAIALGMIIMIISLATGNGLRKDIKDKIINFGGHIQILNYQPNPVYQEVPVSLDTSIYRSIKENRNVDFVQAFGRKAGILKKNDLFEGVVLKGISEDYNWKHFKTYLQEGKIPKYSNNFYNDSILISTALANRLRLKLNDKLKMYFIRDAKAPLVRSFYISGTFKTDFEEIDEAFIIGDLKHIIRLNKWDDNQVSGYEVFLKDQGKMSEIAKNISFSLPYDLDAISARELNIQIFQWLDLFDLNIIIILIIIVAVATVNMSIALLILIMERTQMIGILKALGAQNQSIQQIFLLNASWLILKGLAYGNAIGIGLCLLQQQFGFIKLDPDTYYVSQVSVDLNPLYLLALNLGTMLICLICLVLPSLLITRISPIKALSFD